MIVGVFFTLSKYVSQYSLIDTSEAAEGAEVFMFENIKEKAIKTVQISNVTNIEDRIIIYRDFVEEMVSERGYTLSLNYLIDPVTDTITISMDFMSERYSLTSTFSEPIPPT
jgi:hypothetical protein